MLNRAVNVSHSVLFTSPPKVLIFFLHYLVMMFVVYKTLNILNVGQMFKKKFVYYRCCKHNLLTVWSNRFSTGFIALK